jgi:nondiscriminating aspartyl-tRNA synthetase
MDRQFIANAKENVDKDVKISGWVENRRDHGKLVFLDIRDRTGVLQCVALDKHREVLKIASSVRSEWALEIDGIMHNRPEQMVNPDTKNGDVELEMTKVKVLSEASELPFDRDEKINIDTNLDHRPLTLRAERSRAIFFVQSHIVEAFRRFLKDRMFVEFQAPAIVGNDAEGGAAVFSVDYFDKKVSLATSPQLYKQIMVGVFERVFTIANVYRAERHSTSRHLNEYTSLDFEFGFIEDHETVMILQEEMMSYMTDHLKEHCDYEFASLDAKLPVTGKGIPRLKLREAQKILESEFNEKCKDEPDLNPEQERMVSEYVMKEHGSDFVFITHYPVDKRPFYTYEDEDDPGYTKSFDLLMRGLEVTTGGQRIHDYDTLVSNIKKWKLQEEDFEFYLQSFKYGMPPEGGSATGLERLTAKYLGLDNLREAALFPRDMNRIDTRLSKDN